MRILLLKPNSSHAGYGEMLPIGLAYIGAVLKKEGYNVKALDFSVMDKEWKNLDEYLSKELKKFKPSLVGITCNTAERFNMFKLVGVVKKYLPNTPLIAGGPHVTAATNDVLKHTNKIDAIVRGESEITLIELCKKLKKGKSWKNIKGISYKKNGKIIHNPPNPRISDLDSIPFPARELFNNKKYNFRIPLSFDNNVTGIITSRGCPYNCNFCSGRVMWQCIAKFRSPKNIVDEMEEVLKKYPWYDGFFLLDDNILLNKEKSIEFCREIKRRGLKIIWGSSGRADLMDEELAKEMASSGCKMLSFGVESGSEKVLKLMNKEISLKNIKKAVDACHKYGIQARGTFIFGYPGEGFIDMFKTFKVINYFRPHSVLVNQGVFLYPGTEVSRKHLKNFTWSKPIPEDIPSEANIPRYKTRFDSIRTDFVIKFVRFMRIIYVLTHPKYAIKRTKLKLNRFLNKTNRFGSKSVS